MSADRHILLVDDDPQLREQVCAYLRDHGMVVHAAGDSRAMEAVLDRENIDLIILDLNLPGEDGLSICRRLTATRSPAIIMASAAGEEIDRVLGLELGADDYLPKPFSPRELLARIRAVLRRQDEIKVGVARRGGAYLFQGFSFEPAKRQLRAPSGAMVLLTSGEASILSLLLANAQHPLSRDALLGPSQSDADPEGRAIDLQVSRLRRKLEVAGGGDLIKTRRGLGYMIDTAVSRS